MLRKGQAQEEFNEAYASLTREARARGYEVVEDAGSTLELTLPSGLKVVLVFRGRLNGYEPRLYQGEQHIRLGLTLGLDECACVCVRPPFRAAGHFALEWLGGRPLPSLLEDFDFEDRVPGHGPAGLALRAELNR